MPAAVTPRWVRFADEATACPACASLQILVIDVMAIRPVAGGRRIAFLTGCRECGLLFANPLPTAEQLAAYYANDGTWADSRAERMAKIEKAYLRAERKKDKPQTEKPKKAGEPELLLKALSPYLTPIARPGARVLDYGCGDGKLLNRFQEQGWDTCGIEPSTDVPFLRHQRVFAAPQDASFDLVVLHHVLEHIPAGLDVLREVAGAVREGGALFISVPNLDTLPVHGDITYCIDGWKHLASYSARCLAGLLARAGFTVAGFVSAPELDIAHTKGKPMRCRVMATRTTSPLSPPDAPLVPAIRALRKYVRVHEGIWARAYHVLPVRVRAARMDPVRERQRRKQKRPST